MPGLAKGRGRRSNWGLLSRPPMPFTDINEMASKPAGLIIAYFCICRYRMMIDTFLKKLV